MPTLRETNNPRQVITHLDHLEDLVVTRHYQGATEAETFITGLVTYFTGEGDAPVDLTVKIDGAPSIVVGKDPTDKAFFVGTKGALSKTPKIAKNHTEIETLYDGKPGLVKLMKLVFDLLSPLSWPKILQGDVLFTPDIKQVQEINGVMHVTFQPNTLLYAVPTNSPLGQKFLKAQLGVTFHTTYTGSSLETMSAGPGVNAKTFPDDPDVAFLSNEYQDLSGVVTFTRPELRQIENHIRSLKLRTPRLRTNVFVKLLKELPLLQSEFMVFQNTLVRKNKPITLTPKTFGKQFVWFLAMRHRLMAAKRVKKSKDSIADRVNDKAELDAIRTRQGTTRDTETSVSDHYKASLTAAEIYQRQRNAAKRNQANTNDFANRYKVVVSAVAQSYEDVVEVLEWQDAVVAIKKFLLKKLNVPSKLATFYDTERGLVAGPHEGFVAVDTNGKFVKLIDRSYFSRINFANSRFKKT